MTQQYVASHCRMLLDGKRRNQVKRMGRRYCSKIYINGSLNVTRAQTGTANWTDGGADLGQIGNSWYGESYYFNGTN